MALGGGTWLKQNKVLPGSYINFVSAAKASSELSSRGIATMPLQLSWGPDGEIFTVTADDFRADCLKLLGYNYADGAMKPLRDLFTSIKTAHLFKLNSGGKKASNTYATAKYTGVRGNALKIVVEKNEAYSDGNQLYDVSTYLDTLCVDVQKGVLDATKLVENDYVTWLSAATLALTAGLPLTGGTDGTVSASTYQAYLDKAESFTFNTMGCTSTDETVKALFVAYNKRLRDEYGVKFQTVLFRCAADFEGIISIENGLKGDATDPSLVYWATGAEAGCAVNATLTNAAYTGEYVPNTDYTQAQLGAAIKAGKLMLHQVDSKVRVLSDVNTLQTFTSEKSSDFAGNQTVRVLDQIGNDIAVMFNTKYIGQPNDAAGRTALWGDIVKHHQKLQELRAIEGFNSKDVTVSKGDGKKDVVVSDAVMPINAMERLYMTVYVS